MVKILALEILHHQVRLSRFRLAEIDDPDQVRVSQARSDLGLSIEARQGLPVGGQVARHHLDGHALVEPELDRLVHGAHTTLADQTRDVIGTFEYGAHESVHARLILHDRSLLPWKPWEGSHARSVDPGPNRVKRRLRLPPDGRAVRVPGQLRGRQTGRQRNL